ncbi:MAG TPA: hypothetical protein VH518_04920 [Tepidisphaeraceae bacterium]|jgi:hypothetical protein
MKIVVGGYIVAYPLGGMTWHHLNYLLGLEDLGHEVLFLEDSGSYAVPYNPTKQICENDSAFGRAYLERTFREFGLKARWCYYSEFEDQYYGATREQLNDALRDADLLLCVSGVTPLRDDRPRPRRAAVIDTDPVFTQIKLGENPALLNYYRNFDAVATFGRLVGTSDCPLPTHGIRWIPTNQPVALKHWPVVPTRSRTFTTIGKWEHAGARHVEFAGRPYQSSKSVALMELLDLPPQVKWDMSVAMKGMPADIEQQFRDHGWTVTDAEAASADCGTFRAFIQQSAGEFTVVKQIYSGLLSGWFSDRAACYLASGRPVVTQASGFDRWLPIGEGLFSFHTVDQAADALNTISGDYERHARAARRTAEMHFDSRLVLRDLLDAMM